MNFLVKFAYRGEDGSLEVCTQEEKNLDTARMSARDRAAEQETVSVIIVNTRSAIVETVKGYASTFHDYLVRDFGDRWSEGRFTA